MENKLRSPTYIGGLKLSDGSMDNTLYINDIPITGESSTDLSNYVQKTTTIAGIAIQNGIDKANLLTALNVEDGAEVNTVDSVNGQTGAVVLDADDISDTNTTNKFISASEKAQIGINATDIAALQAEKLDKKPDGTTDLIDSNNKINVPYLPDFVVGQMLNAGVITSLDGETATAELTTGGKSKLGVSSNTLILTNDTATPTGYLANENNYYMIGDNTGVKDGEVLRNDNLNLLKNTFAYNNYGILSFTKRSTGSIVINGNTDNPDFSVPFSTGQTDIITTFIFKAHKSYTLSSYNELDGFSNPDYKFGRGAKYYICTNANTSTNDNGLTNSNFWEEITVLEWATGSTYSVGDYVYKIGGRYNVTSTNIHYFYKCIQANTADDTNTPANNASNSYWQLISVPVWDIGNSYSVGNYARDFIEFNLAYDTGFWTHYTYNTNGFIGTDSGERASLVFQKGFATFVNNTDEDIEIRLAMRLFSSDYIISSGVLYKCIVSGLGHPLSDTDYWQVVSFTTWDSSELYSEGDYVVYNGSYYLCRTSNSGNTPSASNEYWVRIRTSGSYNSTDYYSAYNYNDFEIKLAVYDGLFTRETLPEYQPYLSMFAGLYFEVGDWLVATASGWGKIDNVDAVKSVNGKTGFVQLQIADIPNLQEELDGKLTEPTTGLEVGKYFRIASIDANGHAVLEAVDAPTAPVQSISAVGTALTPDANGNVNIPTPSYGKYGLIRGQLDHQRQGIRLNDILGGASLDMMRADSLLWGSNHRNFQSDARSAITNINMDYAVKLAMTDGIGTAWTDIEKAAGRLRMGAEAAMTIDTDTTSTTFNETLIKNTRYVLGTLTDLTITFPTTDLVDGDKIIIGFVSGSTATTLTRDTVNAIYNFNSISSNVFVELNAEYKASIGKWVVLSSEVQYTAPATEE